MSSNKNGFKLSWNSWWDVESELDKTRIDEDRQERELIGRAVCDDIKID